MQGQTPVPAHYQGVWQRTLLSTADGRLDSNTRVFWLQSRQFHADVRIPLDRPQLAQEQRLDRLDEGSALALTRQGGFAGRTKVDGARCSWLREIDYRPPEAQPDVGVMEFTQTDSLIETCPDGRYVEHWRRLPESHDTTQGLRLQELDPPSGSAPRSAYLLICGAYFAFVRSRTSPLSAASGLGELVATAGNGASLAAMLDCEASFGRHHTGWRIELSTLPMREKSSLFTTAPEMRNGQLIETAELHIAGLDRPSRWRIIEAD